MEIAADAPALFILRAEKMARKEAQRFLGIFQPTFRFAQFLTSACMRSVKSRVTLEEADEVSVNVFQCGDDDVGPESRTILANAPAFVLDSSIPDGNFEFAFGLASLDIFGG